MVPVIIIVIAWWASSGVVARIRGNRAAGSGQTVSAAAFNSGPGAKTKVTAPNATASAAGAARSRRPLAPGDVTFRQWQRSLYDRSKRKLRSHIFGKGGGGKAKDLLGDFTAAAIAGSLAFGMGFTLGGAWAGARTAQRKAQKKTQPAAGTPRSSSTGSGWRRPGNPRPGTPSGGAAGFTAGRWRTAQDQTPPRYANGTGNDGVIEAELLDDGHAPPTITGGSQYASNEYADVVLPELLAKNPTITTAPNGHAMAEILTIHHLFAWAKTAIAHAVNAVEQSKVRASSAIERASHALVRSGSAVTRHENAIATAEVAHQHATQLEETAARFSGLRMDNASMTSIGVAITTAVGLAQAERRRAETAAVVAERAAALAAAEQADAEANQACAQAAILHTEAVKNMHDTVAQHQMPHSEALAMTGNDAAHPSALAAS